MIQFIITVSLRKNKKINCGLKSVSYGCEYQNTVFTKLNDILSPRTKPPFQQKYLLAVWYALMI